MVPSASPQLVNIYASAHKAGRDQTVHRVSTNLSNHSNHSKPNTSMVPSASPRLVNIYASAHQAGRDQTVHKVGSNLSNHSKHSKPNKHKGRLL